MTRKLRKPRRKKKVTIEETMFMLTESSDFYVVNCWFETFKQNTTTVTSRLKALTSQKVIIIFKSSPFSNLHFKIQFKGKRLLKFFTII
jgi:hypothetical protein